MSAALILAAFGAVLGFISASSIPLVAFAALILNFINTASAAFLAAHLI